MTIYCCRENQKAKTYYKKDTQEEIYFLEKCYKCNTSILLAGMERISGKNARELFRKWKKRNLLKELKVEIPKGTTNPTWIHTEGDKKKNFGEVFYTCGRLRIGRISPEVKTSIDKDLIKKPKYIFA